MIQQLISGRHAINLVDDNLWLGRGEILGLKSPLAQLYFIRRLESNVDGLAKSPKTGILSKIDGVISISYKVIFRDF